MVQKEFRLQILGLLCSYVRLQGPHLYQVLQTPLLDHLLQCLENDTSTTVIALALTVLIMFMPHLCNSLGPFLPRLFVVYTRVLCWDKFGVVRVEENRFPSMDAYSRAGTPLSIERSEESVNGDGWQKLNSSFETATSTMPDVSDYFSFLYGLYPINFIGFIREPYKFLERVKYKDIDLLEIEEETIRQRTELYRQRHTLHPNFLVLTAETELSDQSRWMRVEPADVTAQCIGLVNNNIQFDDTRHTRDQSRFSSLEALVPTDEIPEESLLSKETDSMFVPNPDTEATTSPANGQIPGQVEARKQAGSAATSRHSRVPDSPTIPTAGFGAPELQSMLNLQEQLQLGFHDMKRAEEDPSHSHHSGPPPVYPGSATQSPALEAYASALNNTTIPRSPALRPALSDTVGTISYLQREVMLLKNDLNFERYLKQQHLSHIGHLQRKHIKESTAEAETQNLINTNKTLKAKLEDAKKAYAASRQEALKSKKQAKKWEAELSAKIRTLREEQKAWRQDEVATKKGLQSANEETEKLRRLLQDSEADGLRARQKLMSLNANIDEVNKLKAFVEHLSNKLTDYDAREQEFVLQRHNEEAAMQQVERMQMRVNARDEELQKLRRCVNPSLPSNHTDGCRNYEEKVQEMDSRLISMIRPPPAQPGPAFQNMIDFALTQSNSRLTSIKKAHNHLLKKYTELEIKYIELQASHEMSTLNTQPSAHSLLYSEIQSDAEGHRHHRSIHKPLSDADSMSPHSSFTESTNVHFSAQMSPGGYHASPDPVQPDRRDYFDRDHMPRQLRHKSSAAESVTTGLKDEDAMSVKTVMSSTSSETARKIKPQSEVRVRGRGGE